MRRVIFTFFFILLIFYGLPGQNCSTNDKTRGDAISKALVPPGYKSYEQIVALADSLATNFPSICKKVIYGTSIGGRELAALKISRNVGLNEPEPSILFDGGIHGDEFLGPEIVIRFAKDLCTGYGSDTSLTNLINTRAIWLYYMVNPDGTANMTRDNSNGVDCNRDAGYMWNGEGNSTGAFSQNETRALRECMIGNQFSVYINFHAGNLGVIYPWSFRSDPTPDNIAINQLAYTYSSASGYTNFPYGQGYTILGYYSTGSTKDFLYGTMGNMGFSVEVSTDKQPPSSQIIQYYDLNFPAMKEMIIRCGYGLEGVVTDSLSGKPLSASIWVNGFYPVYTDPQNGDYHKYAVAGNYTITASANGYKSKTISNIGVPPTGSTVTNFQLVPENEWAAYSVISCQVPVTSFTGFTYPAYTPAVLGAPDGVSYSLWKSGWIVLDMKDTIFNGAGADFRVVEGGNTPNGFSCYAGACKDGPWTLVGTGTGTTEFDLSSATGGAISKTRYLKIIDDGDGPSTGSELGFDLDAVELITQPLLVDFTASGTNLCGDSMVTFTDQSRGNPVSWQWLFPGGNPSASALQDPPAIAYDSAGIYDVSLTISNGISSSTIVKKSFISINIQPVVNLGNDTTLNVADSILLDAGNPGSKYHWSTGDTTQAIYADSSGVGAGTRNYSVMITDEHNCIASDSIRITFSFPLTVKEKMCNADFIFYPNPTDGLLHLVLPGSEIESVRLISPLGRTVYEQNSALDENCTSLNLTGYPKGLYFLEIESRGKRYFEKVVLK